MSSKEEVYERLRKARIEEDRLREEKRRLLSSTVDEPEPEEVEETVEESEVKPEVEEPAEEETITPDDVGSAEDVLGNLGLEEPAEEPEVEKPEEEPEKESTE